jgi:uroporphyrinogen decarboxylase
MPDFTRLRKVLTRDGLPDYVPLYELFLNQGVMERLLGKKITDRASTVGFYYKAGYDYVPVWPNFHMELGSLVDASGGYPISDWKSFYAYVWPEPSSICLTDMESVRQILPGGMQMIAQNHGMFETVQMLTGYENLCYLLKDDPELVEAVFSRVLELYIEMYKRMSAAERVGAVVISDDFGFKTQTLISPADLVKYVLPGYKILAQIIHDAGKPCILHSCGRLTPIMDYLIDEVKIDAKHSFEDAILPVTEAVDLYGDRIAILGGVDVNRLCNDSDDELEAYINGLLEATRGRGGYALGSGNSITDYVPTRSYLKMLEIGWRERQK